MNTVLFEKLIGHVGHRIEVVIYGLANDEPVNVAVECVDCCTVLVDAESNPANPANPVDISEDGPASNPGGERDR